MNSSPGIPNKTIAVLPFVNMSPDGDNEYFSDGITEEIINALAKIDGLKVTSRTSAFYFKGRNIPITEIGKQLSVSTLLEGSVRLNGNSLRITAQLIDAMEDFHFWSESWDRSLDNVFRVQDEISLLIAERLREHFGHFEIEEHLIEPKTQSVDAFKLYLRGQQTFNKWNPEDVKQSMPYYKQALEIDPNHAEALVGLADAYSFLATVTAIPYTQGWAKCAELTDRALQINDKLPAAYYQLANIAFFTRSDFREAFQHAKKAVSLNANYVESQQFMAFLYILAGKEDDARKHLDQALSVDPLSQETLFYKAYIDYMSGHFSESLQQLDACLEVNPMNIPVHSVKTMCLLKMGRYDEAIAYFDGLPNELVIAGEKAGIRAIAFALKADMSEAQGCIQELKELSRGKDGFTAHSYLFLLAGATKNYEEAFTWVEAAIKTGSPLLLLRYSDPLISPIRDDPRYARFHDILFPPELFETISDTRQNKVLLDDAAVTAYKSKLLQLIESESPHLKPDLTLSALADRLNIHANQLSWLLNQGFNENFNAFINRHRVTAFMERAKKPGSAHLTIMAIAYDCGFNSKTVFNTVFKKETGITPRQFLKE